MVHNNKKFGKKQKTIYNPRWSPAGNYIYFLREEDGTQELVKLEASPNPSKEKIKVIQTGLQAYGFSISRDNKKLCYTKYNEYLNLWDYTYSEISKHYEAKKLTDGTSSFYAPKISRNGKEICFVHNENVFKSDINGDSIKQLTFLSKGCWSACWIPNSEEIGYVSESKLYKISSEGGIPELLIDKIGSDVYWLKSSEIYYHNLEWGNFYIYNFITKEKKLLISNHSAGTIWEPCLSQNNVNIAVWWIRWLNGENGRGLWVISTKDSSQKLIMKGFVVPIKWSKDGKWIYAINRDKSPHEVIMISPTTGISKLILKIPSDKIGPYMYIDISSDGKIIVAAIPETNSDVWMIENFDPDVE